MIARSTRSEFRSENKDSTAIYGFLRLSQRYRATIACEHANMLDPGPLGEIASLLAAELKRRTNGREES